MSTYKIIRFHQVSPPKTIKTGLTLEEAQEHCNDPETNSRTATRGQAKLYANKHGAWFDGKEEE